MSISPHSLKHPQSPRQSQTVHFDIDHNTFITINKESGNEFTSHKNGHPITIFKPNITGFHYNLRKAVGQNNRHSLESVPFPQHKTINKSNRKQIDRQHRFLKPIKKGINDIGHTKMKLFRTVQKQKSQSFEKQQSFIADINKYATILRQKSQQNHSPKKNVIQGSQQIKDPMSSMIVTMKDFQKTDFTEFVLKRKKKEIKNKFLSEQFQIKKHVMRQKIIFQKFHPQLQIKTQGREQAFKERRRNMLKLQKLFLYQANKSTSKIYHNY